MTIIHQNILIISDIEGSSDCWNYDMSSFKTTDWPRACVGMSLDVNAVCKALFEAGVESILVKDFHRTGYNLLPELIDERVTVVHGYQTGPVPGIGATDQATAVMMIGMHAPSGSDGFLAHTLTSRIASLTVNGDLMSEVELFSASLAPFNVVPIFFSGCPVACRYAESKIESLLCFPIDKSKGVKHLDAVSWRCSLAKEAVKALSNPVKAPFEPKGPFSAKVEMRDGPLVAQKLAKRWGLEYSKAVISLEAENIHMLFHQLMRLCYLTPLIEKVLPIALPLFNLRGKWGLNWARQRINHPLQRTER